MEQVIFAATAATPDLLNAKVFYVIDLFPYPQFVMNEDGLNKEFGTYEDAELEANDCQEGIVAVF